MDDKQDSKAKYTAPALEKGLDILEALSRADGPILFPTLVKILGRSAGELFRMMQVLERRELISSTDEGWSLTSRLFEMGVSRPPLRGLIETALPRMRDLAIETKQSCHLVFASRGDMVVVARMESYEQAGFSVRIGYRRPLHTSGSGTILYAFQSDQVRREWENLISPALTKAQLQSFRIMADEARKKGFSEQPSSLAEGVTDLAVPIVRGGHASAALAIPFINIRNSKIGIRHAVDALQRAAGDISAALPAGDSRA